MPNGPTLSELKNHFKVSRKDAAGFVLMLYKLKVGDEYNTTVGRIVKLDETSFKLLIDDIFVETLIEEWVKEESTDVFSDLFDD